MFQHYLTHEPSTNTFRNRARYYDHSNYYSNNRSTPKHAHTFKPTHNSLNKYTHNSKPKTQSKSKSKTN